jgi:glucose/arabinose dehydrogenase
VVSSYTFPSPNLTPAETWASGVRAPTASAFSPTGELWEVEHGPQRRRRAEPRREGQELRLALVSYGMNYNDGADPRARHSGPEFAKPVSLLESGHRARATSCSTAARSPSRSGTAAASSAAWRAIRSPASVFDGKRRSQGPPSAGIVGKRIRDVAEAPDGTLWLLEDANPGRPDPHNTRSDTRASGTGSEMAGGSQRLLS